MKLSEITPAIFAGLGLSQYESRLGISPHGREVLFLIDGFGAQAMDDYTEAMPNIMAGKSFGDITTAFPSTTSTSLATLLTGSMPNEHGMLGYTVRVPNSDGRVLNALKWDERVDPLFLSTNPEVQYVIESLVNLIPPVPPIDDGLVVG